jgi:hypothetical protein
MPETIAGTEDEVRYMSPPEYIKRANARDSRVRHAIDLAQFITYLQTSAGLLREMPENKIEALIAEYLDEKGTQP